MSRCCMSKISQGREDEPVRFRKDTAESELRRKTGTMRLQMLKRSFYHDLLFKITRLLKFAFNNSNLLQYKSSNICSNGSSRGFCFAFCLFITRRFLNVSGKNRPVMESLLGSCLALTECTGTSECLSLVQVSVSGSTSATCPLSKCTQLTVRLR